MTLEEKFELYHANNPHVYELFRKFAKQARHAGHTKFSSKAVFERLRWNTMIETKGDPFKVTNNYTAYYARKLMNEYPEFKGFFETREIRNLT